MKKLYIILIVIFVIFLIIFALPLPMKKTTTLKYKDFVFETEIRDTNAGRKTGLMDHEILERNQAMLFVFEESKQHGMWMKNMKFPIDILWLDQDYKIIDIKNNVQPCESDPCTIYMSQEPAKYVLEIAANLTNELNMLTGDIINQE